MWQARQIWNCHPDKERRMWGSDISLVVESKLSLHVGMDVLPSDGRLEHVLGALMFLKLYTGQKTLCSLEGGVE